MNILTSSVAAVTTDIANMRGQAGFIIVVAETSPAPLRVITGIAFLLEGVPTEDPDGIIVPAGGSVSLPMGAYMLRTDIDGTSAVASVTALNPPAL